jgi:arylsulfatase A-like enzyme
MAVSMKIFSFQYSLVIAILIAFMFFGLFSLSCENRARKYDDKVQPNILWLVAEDLGPYIPPFGDSTIVTPNLSRLASEGIVYPNLFSTSGVCAPSRAAIATGMYPSSIGANHMRTNSYTEVTGLPAYEAVPPPQVKMISELMREQGYFCTNNYKEDYQFKAPNTAWDENGPYAHWRSRKKGQPFYAVFNFTETHESGLFEPYGHRHIETRHHHSGDRTYTWESGRMTEEQTPFHLSKNTEFFIPPYLPDTEVVRRDMWKLYNNIAEMDKQLGVILSQLEEDGLLENTIIFFYGDHGGPLPRQKRLIYDSGLNTPLIIRMPEKQAAGTIDKQLISFIDFAPTLLSLAEVKPPSYLHGQAFLGDFKTSHERRYIHAAADRFDAMTDVIRAVRDDRFKYIRNYRPDTPYYLPIEYREKIPTMQELLRLRDNGQLDSVQMQWFRNSKPKEELFDCDNDPHELHNIADNPKYQDKLVELRSELDRWLQTIEDQPNFPERELISHLWEGSSVQPLTVEPKIEFAEGKIVITCETKGATIGYKMITESSAIPTTWSIYSEPLAIKEFGKLILQAHRIGYAPSKALEFDISEML